MENQTLQRAILNTEDNIIEREIGCFSDEVIKANDIYYLADSYLVEELVPYLSEINAEFVSLENATSELTEVDEESLLILITEDGNQKELKDFVQYFKRNGSRIILLTTNRNVSFINKVDEVLGVNINNSDKEKANENKIFKELSKELLEKVLNRTTQYN